MSAPPCLKVDLDGTEILPKKRAGLAWGNGVLDNEERDEQREAEAAAKEREEDEFDRLYVEVDASDEEEEEEDEDYDEYAEHIPQSVMMGYISTLSQYGYSDFYKLQLLSFEDWEDLKANVGIDPEHEKHLMEALDIKRPKRKVLKRRDDIDNSSDDDDEDDDDATTTTTSSAGTVGLESELMAMALNRRESFQAKSPEGPKADSGSRNSPVMQLSDLEGGLDAQTNDDDDDAALMSLKDRIAARKKEGSFTDKGKEGQQPNPSSSSEATTPGNSGANAGDALRDRIQARKQLESSGKGSELKGSSNKELENAPVTTTSSSPDPASAETSDPKDVLRLRIAARREQTPGQAPAGATMEQGGGEEEKESGKGPVLKRGGSKGSTPKGGRGGGSSWGASKDTSPRSRSPRLGMGLLNRGSAQPSSSSKTNPTPPKGRPNANSKGGPNPTPPRQRPSLADRKKAEEERKAGELRLSAGSSATGTSTGKVSEVALDADGKLVKPSGKQVEKEKASNKTPERGRGREMDKKSTKSRLPTPGRTGWGIFGGTSSQNSSPAAQRPVATDKSADAAVRSRDKSPRDRSPRLKPEAKSQTV